MTLALIPCLCSHNYRKSEPLSDEEDWGREDWDMNLLEPLVEISDQPKNNKKRKRKESTGEQRKRGRPPGSAKSNKQVTPITQNEFINVSVKQEPTETVPVEEVTHNVPMATIPVANTAAPTVPLYVYVPQPQPVVLQHPVEYSVESTDSVLLSQSQNSNSASTSAKTNNDANVSMELETNIKQEEMENVFVMPFGANIETETRPAPTKPATPEPDVILCDSPEETVRKNRTAAIAKNIGSTGPSAAHKKLRDLTFKLVELNNKNLQCDTRIDKIKEEFRKRLQVVEVEKKGIEQEIDNVLASIQEWKERQGERVHK